MAKGNGDGEETRGPTRRVVLRRESVIVLTDLDDTQRAAVLKAVAEVKIRGMPKDIATPKDAWSSAGEFEGSKRSAIEAHAGKPGTPDAKAGDYKAPNLSAWQGGERYKAPPRPLFEREPLED